MKKLADIWLKQMRYEFALWFIVNVAERSE